MLNKHEKKWHNIVTRGAQIINDDFVQDYIQGM